MAEILASAIAEEPERAEEAARQRAGAAGRRIGAEATQPRGDEPAAVLARLGYRPRWGADGELELANCPFRALAAGHTTLICGLNHVFVAGLVEGLGAKGFRVQRVPHEDGCCVELVPEG
jgi:predicted ArsR family transcriptional regulator